MGFLRSHYSVPLAGGTASIVRTQLLITVWSTYIHGAASGIVPMRRDG